MTLEAWTEVQQRRGERVLFGCNQHGHDLLFSYLLTGKEATIIGVGGVGNSRYSRDPYVTVRIDSGSQSGVEIAIPKSYLDDVSTPRWKNSR